MNRDEMIAKIKDSVTKEKSNKARNSMGISESYYNSYYMMGMCFSEKEISQMSEIELVSLLKLAEFAADVFY